VRMQLRNHVDTRPVKRFKYQMGTASVCDIQGVHKVLHTFQNVIAK